MVSDNHAAAREHAQMPVSTVLGLHGNVPHVSPTAFGSMSANTNPTGISSSNSTEEALMLKNFDTNQSDCATGQHHHTARLIKHAESVIGRRPYARVTLTTPTIYYTRSHWFKLLYIIPGFPKLSLT